MSGVCTSLFLRQNRNTKHGNGKVTERGTFDELMDRKGYFYSLFTVSRK